MHEAVNNRLMSAQFMAYLIYLLMCTYTKDYCAYWYEDSFIKSIKIWLNNLALISSLYILIVIETYLLSTNDCTMVVPYGDYLRTIPSAWWQTILCVDDNFSIYRMTVWTVIVHVAASVYCLQMCLQMVESKNQELCLASQTSNDLFCTTQLTQDCNILLNNIHNHVSSGNPQVIPPFNQIVYSGYSSYLKSSQPAVGVYFSVGIKSCLKIK